MATPVVSARHATTASAVTPIEQCAKGLLAVNGRRRIPSRLVFLLPGLSSVAVLKDVGRLVNGAERTVEDVKSELVSEEVEEARRTVEEAKSALVSSRE